MAVVVIIVVASIGVFIYRRKKFEQDLELMLWRVNYNEITFLKNKRAGSEFARGVSQLNWLIFYFFFQTLMLFFLLNFMCMVNGYCI